MTFDYDFLVVGAGPAGAWAACRLARGGARVALADPSHPREKACGGGLTGRALQLVRTAIDPRTLPSIRVRRAVFEHQQREATVPLGVEEAGLPPLVVASRREFDGALVGAAQAAGAELVPRRVVAISRKGAGWIVSTRPAAPAAGNGNHPLTARWLIGADGANSLVRRTVHKPFPRRDLSIAAGYYVPERTADEVAVGFEDSPAGYLWSFPRPDHLAIGVCAQADSSSTDVLLDRARRWICSRLDRPAQPVRYAWPIPSLSADALRADPLAGDGWLLLGDAAGLVDPITREGIFFALQSATLASDALLAGDEPASAYAGAARAEIVAELIRAARLKARFFRPQFMALLVRALQRSGRIRTIMADLTAGRQPYLGLRRRLLRTFELRLMLELFGLQRLR